MKKFIIFVISLLLVLVSLYTLYYSFGVRLGPRHTEPAAVFVKTEGKSILLNRGQGFEPFIIRGVDLGSDLPGKWSADYAVDEETYLRWFGQIQEMGANTIRIYAVHGEAFYNAFYEYNRARTAAGQEPLYLLQGVWVNDYAAFSRLDFYDRSLLPAFKRDCLTTVDVIHGRRVLLLSRMASSGTGRYHCDVSPWVLGYLLGVEWDRDLVIYTDQMCSDRNRYEGLYVGTSAEASPFEAGLAQAADSIIAYETERYGTQRLVAFSNWPVTDPFQYSVPVTASIRKLAAVDAEHLVPTDAFRAGFFASYHVYPFFPDYLALEDKKADFTDEIRAELASISSNLRLAHRLSEWKAPPITRYLRSEDYYDAQGRYNTYHAYLRALNRYHTMPVVISEFGVSTGRGLAQLDENTGRNQGHTTEQEQGEAILACWSDIRHAGCAGGCIFIWQDEWFKHTWNTGYAVNFARSPYWSDVQTNEQYFGLLAFDPGRERSVCYVDGDTSEWTADDLVLQSGPLRLSARYDERFLYFLIHKDGLDFANEQLFLPIDLTPKSGSNYCENYRLRFDCGADFLLVLHGPEDSRLLVQERYESLRSQYAPQLYGVNTYVAANIPEAASPVFRPIQMMVKLESRLYIPASEKGTPSIVLFETGKLAHGNANPLAPDFNSLADFCCSGDDIELRLPWQLLNFADPSLMQIHDDYYQHYGVSYLTINRLRVGLSDSADGKRFSSAVLPLSGWGNQVSCHERLKRSYDMVRELWRSENGAG